MTTVQMLAQIVTYTSSYRAQPAPLWAYLTGAIFGLGISVAVSAIIAYFVSDALSKVPPEHRKGITPGQVWLLLIPLFSLVWNFFVYQRVALSFQSYFEANGRPQPGDYGKQMALIFSILAACSLVPCIGSLTGLAALVLMILLIVKFQGYKKLIVSGGGSAFPVIPPSQPPL